jgi:5'-methylthioadenosine phosphorylase
MKIGVIGGTGIGDRLIAELAGAGVREERPDTPFGAPSGPVRVAEVGPGVEVALLARHGEGHEHPPHRVPYRANVYALRALGVTHVVATGACGSLRESIEPGHVVVADQLIDRTVGRARTFFDDLAVHVEFADPFCPVTRAWLLSASGRAGVRAHDGGTYVCMQGPAFSTRAESESHRLIGGDLIGMTALPEARLAREAEMAYALVALPTDFDCWRPRDAGATADALLREIVGNLERAGEAAFAVLRAALADVSALRATPSPAHAALDHAVWTAPGSITEAARRGVGILLDGVRQREAARGDR